MLITDAHVVQLIERIGEHYRANISNGFIRPALYQAPVAKQTWDLVEALAKTDQSQSPSYHLEELYHQIAATATFVSVLRHDLIPVLRNRLPKDGTASDRVFREMAMNNFSSNLQLFADLVNQLFVLLVELDTTNVKKRRPLYTTIPELKEVSSMLLGP